MKPLDGSWYSSKQLAELLHVDPFNPCWGNADRLMGAISRFARRADGAFHKDLHPGRFEMLVQQPDSE
jgi:hypothetical protein